MSKIVNRFTGKVICEGDCTVRELAERNLANLSGADLSGANLNWGSHDLLSEILVRHSGEDIDKLKVAGLLLVCRNKCWKDFLVLNDPLNGWALDTLAEYVKDGDNAPAVLRNIKEGVGN